MDVLPILQPGYKAPAPAPLKGWPVFRLGFRPFYLGAAAFALVAVPLWVASFLGLLRFEPAVAPLLWHAHEMLFGFAIAVIIGFLLTAGKLWTGLPTPRGLPLALLAGWWLLARLAAAVASYPIFAFIDISLLPVVALIFVSLIIRSRNWRNLPLAIVLSLLAIANISFHLAVSGFIAIAPLEALYAGLALITIVESVIAGRVIPAFTMSATPGLKISPRPALDNATLLVTAVAFGLWIFNSPGAVTGLALAAASVLHLARQWHWAPRATLGRPVLWILQLAYAWIAIGTGLLGAAQFNWIAQSAGIHALAIGATAGLIIGMITRTARGHTGRPIQTTGFETTAYLLIMVAALLRTFAPLLAPQWLAGTLIATAVAWTIAFAIYLAVYMPWLLHTRLDGKDG